MSDIRIKANQEQEEHKLHFFLLPDSLFGHVKCTIFSQD